MLPQPSLPISQPVKSAKYNASGGAPAAGSQTASTDSSDSSDDQSQPNQAQPNLVHAKYDLLVWFEVLELGKWQKKVKIVEFSFAKQLLVFREAEPVGYTVMCNEDHTLLNRH